MKTKNINFTMAQAIRRKNEIAQYGCLLSMRPSVTHKSKKIYSRKNYKIEY